MHEKKYAIIDLETTGFSSTDRVLEIGVALTDAAGGIEKRWSTLVQPERDIPNSFVHGITASDVVDAPRFAGIASELAKLLDGRTVVAHNAAFDTRMLMNEYRRLGIVLTDVSDWSLCTMHWSSRVLPGRPQKLHDCLEAFGITNEQAHSALGDATATAQLFKELLADAGKAPLTATLDFAPDERVLLSELVQERPQPREQKPSEAVGSWVKRLVQDTPRSDDEGLARYRDLLAAALLDKVLSASETKQLAECALAEGLSRDDAIEVHREFLGQIAIEAWADGVVTSEEEATLRRIGAQLGVPAVDVDKLLAQPATGETQNFQLAGGQRVSFTGSMELGRSTWEFRAREVGLEVGSVTKKTVLLVAANPDSMSSKARRARDLRIPIVNEATFALLLGNLGRAVPEQAEKAQEIAAPVQEAPVEATTEDAPELFKDLDVVFPWFTPTHTAMETSVAIEARIAAQWRKEHEAATLSELSPFLSDDLPDSLSITPRAERTWLTRHPAPLEASLLDLFTLRGFGNITVNKILADLVLDAIDSHQAAVTNEVEEYGFGTCIYERTKKNYQKQQENTDLKEQINRVAKAWDAVAMWLSKELSSAPEEVRRAARALDELDPRNVGDRTVSDAVSAVQEAVGPDVRDQSIFVGRTFNGTTLDALGQQFGVTRERIRQLELGINKRVAGSSEELGLLAALLRKHIRTAVRRTDLVQAFPYFGVAGPFEQGDLLSYVLSRTPSLIDGQWLEPAEFSDKLASAIASAGAEHGVTSLATVATQMGMDQELLHERIEWQYPKYIWLDSDVFLTSVSSHQDRVCGLLAYTGQPLSLLAICDRLGQVSSRSLANQLAVDPRVMRVGKDDWALREWGYEEYVNITDWITKRVEKGPVTIQELMDEADSIGVSQNSVRSYASGAHFVNENGYLRLATDEDRVDSKPAQPEYSKHLYQLADGFGYIFTVTHDHVRGSGSPVPADCRFGVVGRGIPRSW